jgi:tetratricopeptide (TPR) repeat protein
MKKYWAILLFTVLVLVLSVHPASAQSGSVKGVCKDSSGNPIADAVVVFNNLDNGQKYALKTNKKGEYFSLGVVAGKYNVVVYRSADDQKAGTELDHANGYHVQTDENTLDFDIKKEQADQAKGAGMTAEQMKQQQDNNEKIKKENTNIKALNDKLNAAKTAADAGDFDAAIAALNDANQIDPNRDLIWFKLGDYNRLSAAKQTDSAEKQKRYGAAIDDYQKAIQLKQAAPPDPKDPSAGPKTLAAYYNNLAEAYAKTNKTDDAVKSYQAAVQANPSQAGQYYFNIGAVLTNAGKADDALAAFDKVIAADPTRADAYYWKGVNLIAKETMDKDNKAVAPPGTAEAFQKYLELAPTGPYADPAKQMLASIGAPVESSFGNKKKK